MATVVRLAQEAAGLQSERNGMWRVKEVKDVRRREGTKAAWDVLVSWAGRHEDSWVARAKLSRPLACRRRCGACWNGVGRWRRRCARREWKLGVRRGRSGVGWAGGRRCGEAGCRLGEFAGAGGCVQGDA